MVSVGIGPRAGPREIEHLVRKTGASALVTQSEHQGQATAELVASLRRAGLPLRHHLTTAGEFEQEEPFAVNGQPVAEPDAQKALRPLESDALWLLNSTSGTTGLPKVVTHDQQRWFAFHEFAVETGALCESDVFMSVVPAPFGFGLWTSHFSPTLLGAPTVLLPRFDATAALQSVEEHGVTVLAAVSTQFIMMLDSPAFEHCDFSSLRALYTGGEAVPYARAREFEERTGACVLQFYGSNETGAVCGTALSDTPEKRLRTAGRPIPEMQLKLFDAAGADVTPSRRGQPGVKGPTLSRGYYADSDANAALLRPDGWMMLGDIVELDDEGYLRVVGRTDDFIIRGGKNISGPAVEEAVGAHPDVALSAAVSMPDPVFGERVCAFVVLREEATPLSLASLVDFLASAGVSKEIFPERLEVVPSLPQGSGGKVAKRALRETIRARLEAEAAVEPRG